MTDSKPAVPDTGLSRARAAKNAVELVMNLLFFVCGIASVLCVVAITIYMLISGVPAIREIGLWDFLFGTEWAPTA